MNYKCEFCANPAIYDSKSTFGPWGFMCEDHFQKYGLRLEGTYTVLKDNIIKEGSKSDRLRRVRM